MDLALVAQAVAYMLLSVGVIIASRKAGAADRQTRAVGNGFAGEVLTCLAEIKAEQREHRLQTSRVETRLDRHLEHHIERKSK